MSVNLTIEHDSKLLVARFSGAIDLEQLCKDVRELVTLPDYNPTWDGISDFSDAIILYSSDDLLEFTKYYDLLPNASKGNWAVIMPSLESYITTTFLETLCRSIKGSLLVFTNDKLARGWLR